MFALRQDQDYLQPKVIVTIEFNDSEIIISLLVPFDEFSASNNSRSKRSEGSPFT